MYAWSYKEGPGVNMSAAQISAVASVLDAASAASLPTVIFASSGFEEGGHKFILNITNWIGYSSIASFTGLSLQRAPWRESWPLDG